jgi:hypothetical protein
MRKATTLILLVTAMICAVHTAKAQRATAPYTKQDLMSKLVVANDDMIPEMLTRQVTQKSNP